MTVETTTSKAGPYAGAGTVGPFPVPFRFLDASHLQVTRTDASGVNTVLTLGADYSVQGVGQVTGAVTLTAVLATGFKLTVLRSVPATQEADYVQNDAFPAESHENALDKLTMIAQQQGERMGRALVVPETDAAASLTLPSAVARARRYLSFDDLGRPISTTFDVDAVAQASQAAQDAAANAKTSEINAAASAASANASADYAGEQAVFVAQQVAAATPTVVRFSGDAVATTFTLPSIPGAEENTQVYISGVYQQKNTYEVTPGTGILIFDSAPPVGMENIEVVIAPSVMVSNVDAQNVSYTGPGGFKYSVSDFADPSKGAGLIAFLQNGAGAIARWVLDKLRETCTPYDFGAVGDGVADDTAPMEKWLARAVAAPNGHYVASGQFNVVRALAANFGGKRVSLHFDCTIISAIPDMVDVLTLSNSYAMSMHGFLGITGMGGTSYANRKNLTGLVVHDCSRFSYDTIRPMYFLRDGIRLTGITSQPDGKYIQSGYCGSVANAVAPAVGWHTTATAAGARSGSSGSTSQSQLLPLAAPLPSYVDATGWFLQIRGELYKITDVADPSNVRVYPWLNNAVVAGDAVDLIGGAGYYSIGGDVSAGRIGHLDAITCGVAHHSLSLYPTNIGVLVSQSCGATAVFGAALGSAITSCDIGYLYSEGDTFGIVLASNNGGQLRIGPTVSFPEAKTMRFAPRNTNNTLSPGFQNLGPGVSWHTDQGLVRGTGMGASGFNLTTQGVFLQGAPQPSYTIDQSCTGITLPNPVSLNAITGLRSIEVVAFGTGANQEKTNNLAFTPPAGHTINGGAAGAALTFSGMTKPAIFKIMFVGGVAWRIAKFDAA